MDEFEQKIAAHRHEFYRFVLRNLWDAGVAEDVFSSAIVAAYDGRQKYTPGTNFRAWMYRILANKCFVANRETHRAFERLDDQATEPASVSDRLEYGDMLENPASFLEQCGEEVYSAMGRLSTSQRTCILLRDVERFSYQEIAEILEMPVGTVMTHLARGRKKLRGDLLEYARTNGILRPRPRLRPNPLEQPQDGGSHGSAAR